METMHCGTRALSLVSLGFGLVATGALSLAVATDYWLFTQEPVVPSNETVVTDEQQQATVAAPLQQSEPSNPSIVVDAHSGLWRTCIIYQLQDTTDEVLPPKVCYSIGYFEQSNERHENADTTMSILRAIRKSAPVIVGSLLLLLTALTLSIVGTTKNDFKIIISAIIYIFSALSLGMGVILYISAVNDEVAHRKKQPESGPDGPVTFRYQYGWAFFFGGATFVCSMAAAVSNISLYLRRYSHFDDTMLIVPAATGSGTVDAAGSGSGAGSGSYIPVRRADMVNECRTINNSLRWSTAERSLHAPNHNLTIPL